MTNKLDKNSIKRKREESSNNNNNNNTILDKIKKKKKEKKYRNSVYLKPSVFEKLITLNAETGESFTDIVEMILEDALADVPIKPRHVEAYKENLKRKQSDKDNKNNEKSE